MELFLDRPGRSIESSCQRRESHHNFDDEIVRTQFPHIRGIRHRAKPVLQLTHWEKLSCTDGLLRFGRFFSVAVTSEKSAWVPE
jgi:hypothetical protein